jgi:transposase
VAGQAVYAATKRGDFLKRLPREARPLVEVLYEELDGLVALQRRAKKVMLDEAKRHAEYLLVRSCPGLGPVRSAELLPIVVTPFRFQSKRGFWAYCGLGIVQRSSSDWVRAANGEWTRASVQQTRGLNRQFNHTLKAIFKGAATTVIGRGGDDPINRHYVRLLDGGTKPNLAKLTIARQLASIVLAVWRTKEVYDPERLESIA